MRLNDQSRGQDAKLRAAELALINAPFNEGGWEDAIQQVALVTGAQGANLVRLGGAMPSLSLTTGYDMALVDDYFVHDDFWGQANWRVGNSALPLQVRFDPHYQAYRQAGKTGDYDDAVADLDMEFGCQTVLAQDDGGFVGLALLRGRREGACSADELDDFRRLIVPAERAVRAERALAGEAVMLAQGQIEQMNAAIFVADRLGVIHAMSEAAELMVHEGRQVGLRLGNLCLTDPAENRRFQAALGSMLRFDRRSGEVIDLALGARRRIGLVAISPTESGLGFDPNLTITLLGDWT